MSQNWDGPDGDLPFPDPRLTAPQPTAPSASWGGGRRAARDAGQPQYQPEYQPDATPTGEASLRRPRIRDSRSPWAMRLNAVQFTRWIWRTAILLVLADFLFSAAAASGVPYSITRFFDGDEKTNFPTAYKTLTLLTVTLLLLALRSHARWVGDKFEQGWLLLAAVAAFAFVDESTYLHQTLSHLLHDRFNTSGLLRYAWTLLYVPALLAVGLLLLRYLRYLSPEVRNRVFVGGVVYGLGAVAMEPLKSHLGEDGQEGSLAFKLTAAVSDSIEMIGLTILVVALLRELARRTDTVAIDLTDVATAESPAAPAAAVAASSARPAAPTTVDVRTYEVQTLLGAQPEPAPQPIAQPIAQPLAQPPARPGLDGPVDPPWSRRQGTNR